MKKLFFLFLLSLILIVASAPVMAGGDQNRGEVGVGDVCQYTATDNGVVIGDGCITE